MAATQDIVATYRGPGKVFSKLLSQGVREDRALIFLMVGCLIFFVAQTPRLAREAFETGQELNSLLAGSLMALVFIVPLVLYLIAGAIALIARLIGSNLSGYGARLALFWALLAASPLILLWGLTAGFVGPGVEMTIVGALWCAAFLWFWLTGLRVASREGAT